LESLFHIIGQFFSILSIELNLYFIEVDHWHCFPSLSNPNFVIISILINISYLILLKLTIIIFINFLIILIILILLSLHLLQLLNYLYSHFNFHYFIIMKFLLTQQYFPMIIKLLLKKCCCKLLLILMVLDFDLNILIKFIY